MFNLFKKKNTEHKSIPESIYTNLEKEIVILNGKEVTVDTIVKPRVEDLVSFMLGSRLARPYLNYYRNKYGLPLYRCMAPVTYHKEHHTFFLLHALQDLNNESVDFINSYVESEKENL